VNFGELLSDLAGRLSAAGLQVATDARDLNPPGVLVRGDAVIPAHKLCGEAMRASVLLVARDSGDTSAYDQLTTLYEAAVPVLKSERSNDEAPFERTVLPDSPAGLPSLRLTVTLA
jgi:hypothetical protein